MGGGAQGLEQSGAALPVRKQGQGWELEQPEHEQVPTWDASAASRGIGLAYHVFVCLLFSKKVC